MSRKTYKGPLNYPENREVNWNGDEFTSNLPIAGEVLQKYFKQVFEKKVGDFYYDNDTNKMLCFSNEESRKKYLEDRIEYKDLLLGSFDAPSLYDAVITLDPGQSTINTIAKGSTGNYIQFTADVLNKSGESVGDALTVQFQIKSGSNVITKNYQYQSGAHISFNIDELVNTGVNYVTVSVVGNSTLAGTSLALTYTVVDIRLTTDFDISQVFGGIQQRLEFPITVEGTGTKIVEWYLDGVQQPYDQATDYYTNPTAETRSRYFDVSQLAAGVHKLQVRIRSTVNETEFFSDSLYREFIVSGSSEGACLVAISTELKKEAGIVSQVAEPVITSFTQYITGEFKFAVYNPLAAAQTSALLMIDDQEVGSYLTENRKVTVSSINYSGYGQHVLRVLIDNQLARQLTLDIRKTDLDIREIAENLMFSFQADGRTNTSENRDRWSQNGITAQFSGFSWNSRSGWVNNALVFEKGDSLSLNVSPLGNNPTAQGRTFEIEFSTKNVIDDEAVLMDLTDSRGTGIVLRANKAALKSYAGQSINDQYKAGDRIRVTFVINRASGSTNAGLAMIYVNGKISRTLHFTNADNFTVDTRLKIEATENAEIVLHQIRAYNTVLTSDDILNNYELYRDTTEELMKVYERNAILNASKTDFDMEVLANFIPVMLVTGNIPILENTTNKNEQIVVDVKYVNNQDPMKSFTLEGAAMRPQGTSSMTYPKKNFRIYSKRLGTTVLKDYRGEIVEDRLYAFKDGSQRVQTWCLKADYAESSSSHNTGIARLWNEILKNTLVNGSYPLRTTAQKKALEAGYPYDVRTCVDGFPIALFYKLTESSTPIFLGKYNFNNDKSTPSVYGFENIPGFDNSHMECWEVTANKNPISLFQTVDNFETAFVDAFEARYPDDAGEETEKERAKGALYRLCSWLVSCIGNQDKFNAEVDQYFDLPKLAAYYVYAMRFGAVDQLVKNAMMTTEDGLHWYFINYDNDTILGVRNDGLLKYDPTIDRASIDEELSDYVYAGHDSTLWNCFENCESLMNLVITIDKAMYSAGLRYDEVIDMFNNKQSGQWCERIFNQDAQYKYIGPWVNDKKDYLELCQGDRGSHRRWWLNERFSLFDSKWISGSYSSKNISLLAPNAPKNQTFKVVAGAKFNYGYGINDEPKETGVSLRVDEEHDFTLTQDLAIGDPLRIYASTRIKELDLSHLAPYMTNLDISAVADEDGQTRLISLICGPAVGSAYSKNNAFNRISGLPFATYLEELNIVGMAALTNVDLASLQYLKKLYAENSGVTNLEFADSAPLEELYLPAVLQALKIKNSKTLYLDNINYSSLADLININITGTPGLTRSQSFITTWLSQVSADKGLCSVVMDDIEWALSEEQLDSLLEIVEKNGTLQLRGKISVPSLSDATVNKLTRYFGGSVFNPNSELYVQTAQSLYIVSRDSYDEGGDYQLSYVVSGISDYETTWGVSGREGTTIDANGVLHIGETGDTAHRTLTVSLYLRSGETVLQARKTINVNVRSYPSDGTLTLLSETDTLKKYKLDIRGSYSGEYSVEWDLATEYASNLVLGTRDKSSCNVNIVGSPAFASGILTATVKTALGVTLFTKNIGVDYQGSHVAFTNAQYPSIVAKLFEKTLINHPDYATKTELSAVTGSQLKEVLSEIDNKEGVTEFNGLAYFTSLTELPEGLFSGYTELTEIQLPESVTVIKSNALLDAKLTGASISSFINQITLIEENGLVVNGEVVLPSSCEVAQGGLLVGNGKLTLTSGNLIHRHSIVLRGSDSSVVLPNEVVLSWTAEIKADNGGTIIIPDQVGEYSGDCPTDSQAEFTLKLPKQIYRLGNVLYISPNAIVDATECINLIETDETKEKTRAEGGLFKLMMCHHGTEDGIKQIFSEGYEGEISDGHDWVGTPQITYETPGNIPWNSEFFYISAVGTGRIHYYDGYEGVESKRDPIKITTTRNDSPNSRELSGIASYKLLNLEGQFSYRANQLGMPAVIGTIKATLAPSQEPPTLTRFRLFTDHPLEYYCTKVHVEVVRTDAENHSTTIAQDIYEGDVWDVPRPAGSTVSNCQATYYLYNSKTPCEFGKDWLGQTAEVNVDEFSGKRLFAQCTHLVGVTLNTQKLVGTHAGMCMFCGCKNLLQVEATSLTQIKAEEGSAAHMMFKDCLRLQDIQLSALQTIEAQTEAGCYMFENCGKNATNAFELNISVLTSVTGQDVLRAAFRFAKFSKIILPELSRLSGNSIMLFAALSCVDLTKFDAVELFDGESENDAFCATFFGCTALEVANLNKFKGIYAESMFEFFMSGCRSLESIGFNGDTANTDVNTTLSEYLVSTNRGILFNSGGDDPEMNISESKNNLWYYLINAYNWVINQ